LDSNGKANYHEFEQYQHNPLESRQIRLLRFSSNGGQQTNSSSPKVRTFDIQVDVVSLDDESKPDFWALSYAWGDTMAVVPLFIRNGTFL
jgi:hypothetical protein